MTTIGKILVVLHLVLSIMFMAFAGAVYTAQTNWHAAEKKTADNLTKEKTKNRDLQAEFDKDRTDTAQKFAEFTNQVATLGGQKVALESQNKNLVDDNAKLRKDVDQQRDLAALATVEATERKKEADLQREKNSELFKSREESVKKLNETEDQRFASELTVQQISDKYDLLLADSKTMKSVLASKGLTTDPKQMVAQKAPPPLVDGYVTEVRKPERGSRELVAISLGSDDGLVVGHKLTITSNGKYIGIVLLTLVEADNSAGVLIEKAKNVTVSIGDGVTSKL